MYDRPVVTHATYLCIDGRFQGHVPPGEHPECPARLAAIESLLQVRGLASRCKPLAARAATEAEILRAHSQQHFHHLEDTLGEKGQIECGWLDPDTYYGKGSFEAALLSAGSSVELVTRLLASERDNGFVLCRPPGHHATRDRAMGFCLLNNVAIAAAAAKAQGARVAIVDFDVHHGNGTEDIFAEDPDVLFISLHQFPYYPGTGALSYTGEGRGKGMTVNLPLPQGCDDSAYRRCFRKVVIPALTRFAPDLILVSAGFDGHSQDPLAGMALTEAGYGEMVGRMLAVQGRLGAVLEGGYHLQALSESVAKVFEVLLGDTSGIPVGMGATYRQEPALDEVASMLQQAIRIHGL